VDDAAAARSLKALEAKRTVLSYNIIISSNYRYFGVATRKAELYYLTEHTENEGRRMRDEGRKAEVRDRKSEIRGQNGR
jgi:hypothetical protein